MENYDIFISHSTKNAEITHLFLNKLEAHGLKCFIAPRDIRRGHDYASEIIRGIQESEMVLLLFSNEANTSGWVLREINSAISRGKKVLCLRLDDTQMAPALEFYLSVNQWVDVTNSLDEQINEIVTFLREIKGVSIVDNKEQTYKIPGPTFIEIDDLINLGFSPKAITMREIELDYLVVPKTKYYMGEEIEGTLEDWEESVSEFADASIALVVNDEIVGYTDIYPISSDDFRTLISGKAMIDEAMIDLYHLKGDFDLYITLIAIDPTSIYHKQSTYLDFIKLIYKKLALWNSNSIKINNMGISVYSSIMEKYCRALGWEYVGVNPAGGKIYTISYAEFEAKVKQLL